MELILSTSNQHKVQEVAQLLNDLPYAVKPISSLTETYETPVEDGKTFEENAIKKIENLPNQPNRFYLSDDSGIVVDGLDGRPGIHSARYGGDGLTSLQQCQLLLKELGSNPNRSARFVCVIALKDPSGKIITFNGKVEGQISQEISGEHGFGYDPIFIPDGYERSFAELGQDIKNKLSHRAVALNKLKTHIKALVKD